MSSLQVSLRILTALGILALPNIAKPQSETGDWPQWRGPNGTGSAPSAELPLEWSEEKNVRWKLDLPGRGSSTPVILGDQVFVTTAVETGRAADGEFIGPRTDAEPKLGPGTPPKRIYEFWVYSIQRQAGTILWKTKCTETVPHEGGHPTNTMASASPLTDGEHIFAFFGSRGLFCLDLQSKLIWSKNFGIMNTRKHFGEGASVAVRGNNLVLVWDHEGADFIACLDKRTGEERWRTEREQVTTWDTPVIAPVGDGEQVIVTGTRASVAYDMTDGAPIWWLEGMTTNCIPSPIYSDGRVWLMSGFRGSALQAVDLEGASGDLSQSDNLAWSLGSNTSYVPSALLHDGLLYFLRGNSGVLSCVDAGTGDVVYSGQRVGDIRTVYASPVGSGNRIFVLSRKGICVVVKAGASFEILGSNNLNDTFDASPALAGDALFLRGLHSLYCIAKKSDG